MLVNNGSTRLWSAINMTANFRWTGEVAASKLAVVQGQRPDFVVGVDVVTLRALLSVEGPVRVPSLPQPITEQSVAPVLLRSLYETFTPAERSQRLGVLSEVIAASLSRAFRTSTNSIDAARALSGQISGRHLLFWSGSPELEASIRALGASGELTGSKKDSTFSVAVESAVAAKMDAFDVVTALNYKVVVQPDRSATIDLAVTVANHAPKHLRPGSYIYGPDGWNAHRPGEYVANVFVWSPPVGAELSAPRDGGLALRATSVDLDPGELGIVHFSSTIPAPKVGEHLWLRLVPQPRLRPTMTTVTVDEGSHHKFRKFSLDSVIELELAA
jgi:hypothetical protein